MNLSEKIRQNFAAFLASFSVQPVDHPAQNADQPQDDNTLNTLFDAVSASYPESFTEIEGFTQMQKAESLTAFFASVNEQLSAADSKLTESTTAFDTLNAEHQALLVDLETERKSLSAANTRITELTEQLSARPSIPLNVTDPKVSLGIGDQEKDETGKQILAAMPKDIKRKLKQS
jgi:phage-related tail protein